jgi:hypothetical protein
MLALARMKNWSVVHRLNLSVGSFRNSTWEIVEHVQALLDANRTYHGHRNDSSLYAPLCDSVVHIDADAFIANLSWYPTATSTVELLFTKEDLPPHYGLNTGVFWVRNTPRSRAFVRTWALRGEGLCNPHVQWPEQTCARRLVQHQTAPHLTRIIKIVPLSQFNQPLKFNTRDREALAAQMASCCTAHPVCHPFGVHFWCKHYRSRGETIEQCTTSVRSLLHRSCYQAVENSY